MSEQATTRTCDACGETKPLVAFPARRKRCQACIDTAKAKIAERKERVEYTEALGRSICDAVAAGLTLDEACARPSAPSVRQIRAWRRADEAFNQAMEVAEAQSASAHLDAAKGVLKQAEAGKLAPADAKFAFDAHMRLAGVLNPRRYGAAAATAIDITSAGRPLVDLGSAIKALLDATANLPALPAPEPIDVEVELVEQKGSVH